MGRAILIAMVCACAVTAQDAREIVKRSVDRDARNFERFKDYTFQQFTQQRMLDKKGNVSSTETELEDVVPLGGRPYYHLLERNGRPLSEKDARKEQEKLDKEAAKRARESERERAKYERERRQERSFAREIPDAFTFTLLGEEQIDGLPVWKIRAEPKPGYKPRARRAGAFKNVRGTLWIDQAGYQWVKADIDVIGTISWGLFILRIPPGAKIEFLQTRVNDEVWLPKQVHIRADAKLGLVKTYRADVQIDYRNYRKYRTESQVLDVEELPQESK
jgi:hypothetical protein